MLAYLGDVCNDEYPNISATCTYVGVVPAT